MSTKADSSTRTRKSNRLMLKDPITDHLTVYALSRGFVQSIEQDAKNWLTLEKDTDRNLYVLNGCVDGIRYQEEFRRVNDARKMFDEAKEYFGAPQAKRTYPVESRVDKAAAAIRSIIAREDDLVENDEINLKGLSI